jgi:hypothetical protein
MVPMVDNCICYVMEIEEEGAGTGMGRKSSYINQKFVK